ncbi:hypothetical protein BGW36DRAFT_368864 [Talaromyces proteolyticus]|uniref:Short-chain dehydrogenase/reductase n=1 Tax=Talaromyces proteolyticus TaxID=1131652 RepID=A0AAD4Q4D7_9EURO|nr:uncharacterized protein BGW36DRAFT_368864 [Talaromyces proteolyticus]KAH8703131.1 hypothetical protein BGW36DRAFT_368864 [Talaromyces proteolyticus]
MVSISEIRAHNATIKKLGSGLVAVFVGGTSGIGLSTAREFTRNATAPHIYLIGRNESQASQIITELRGINDSAQVSFIKTDVSLLKSVDEACQEIGKKEEKVNLLFMTPGVLTMQGRTETSEGLDRKLSLHYYARMRFVQDLLPQLNVAGSSGSLARVISVLGPGNEKKLVETDLDLKTNYSLSNAAGHAITMNSLSLIHFAATNPSVSFLHSNPGGVQTNAARELNPILKGITSLLFLLLKPFPTSSIGIVPLSESGERHTYAATTSLFSPKNQNVATTGADGEKGSGAYRLGFDTAPIDSKQSSSVLVKDYLANGVGKKVWEHTTDIFNKATGSEGK